MTGRCSNAFHSVLKHDYHPIGIQYSDTWYNNTNYKRHSVSGAVHVVFPELQGQVQRVCGMVLAPQMTKCCCHSVNVDVPNRKTVVMLILLPLKQSVLI